MPEQLHPYMENYQAIEGPNIKSGWLLDAVCRTLDEDEAAEIFLPSKSNQKREDIPICDDCPARDSCLMDSLANNNYPLQGRRAGFTGQDRLRTDAYIVELFDGKRKPPIPTDYGGQVRAEYYSSHPLAMALVGESIRFIEDRAEFIHRGGTPASAEQWPTELAIEIRDQVV